VTFDAIQALRHVYCSTTGYDYSHVFVREERDWLRQAAGAGTFSDPADSIEGSCFSTVSRPEIFMRPRLSSWATSTMTSSAHARARAWLVLLGALLLATTSLDTSQNPSSGFPSRLDSYFKNAVRLTSGEQRQLAAGQPVTKLLDADASKEVAVFGAIWINAPMRRYVDAVKDIESFERGGGFKLTRRISSPPRLEDFADLQLPQEDLADLRTCRVGRCDVKLGEQALNRFRSEVNWNDPDAYASANRLMQRLAFEYVTRYLEGGNDGLAVYRDNRRPTFVAQEFRSMVDSMPALTTYMPNMRSYLLGYPKVALADATTLLYWQETEFGLKPTIRISHLTIREQPADTVVTSKMLYATHYFWTGLELRVLMPDPSRGAGFWFVTVNRSRSDGLSGFTGMFVRRRVRSEVQEGAMAGLRSTKQRLENAD
jgi:hypothetical protein